MQRLQQTALSPMFWAGCNISKFHFNEGPIWFSRFSWLFPKQRTFCVLLVDPRQNHFAFMPKRPATVYVSLCICPMRYNHTIHCYHLLPVFIVSQERGAHKEVKKMDNNKKPSEPVEEERWALKDVPTSQLVEELVNRTGVTAESSWWCRMSSYHIIIRINLNKEDCPQCLR